MTHFLLDDVVGAEAVVVVVSTVMVALVLPDVDLLFGCLPKMCLLKVPKLWLYKHPFI